MFTHIALLWHLSFLVYMLLKSYISCKLDGIEGYNTILIVILSPYPLDTLYNPNRL